MVQKLANVHHCTDLDDEGELGVLLVPVPQVLPAYTFQAALQLKGTE